MLLMHYDKITIINQFGTTSVVFKLHITLQSPCLGRACCNQYCRNAPRHCPTAPLPHNFLFYYIFLKTKCSHSYRTCCRVSCCDCPRLPTMPSTEDWSDLLPFTARAHTLRSFHSIYSIHSSNFYYRILKNKITSHAHTHTVPFPSKPITLSCLPHTPHSDTTTSCALALRSRPALSPSPPPPQSSTSVWVARGATRGFVVRRPRVRV